MEECVGILKTMLYYAPERSKEEIAIARAVHLPKTLKNLERVGLTLEDLDHLSPIHVSGTKGKGSTCAFVESILRKSGYKTGFFSSPHLVDWRDRIRINGKPISSEKFVSVFWELYNRILDTQGPDDGGMPPFFRMVFFMAIKTFLDEKVDVAIFEVGLGGEYDSTNILRCPVVCGTSRLDLDHTHILGNTIEEIAWNKAGIFKRGVPAFTVPQADGALPVLKDRAMEKGATLQLCPDLSDYDWGGAPISLGIHGDVQRMNTSLALQLCRTWMRDQGRAVSDRLSEYGGKCATQDDTVQMADTFKLSPTMIEGLRDCSWPGRTQVISKDKVTYYLDGAHTPESMQLCAAWFQSASERERQETVGGRVCRVLVFNTTGIRASLPLLEILRNLDFQVVVFCTNYDSMIEATKAAKLEQDVAVAAQERCLQHKTMWDDLIGKSSSSSSTDIPADLVQHEFSGESSHSKGAYRSPTSMSSVLPCIKDALQWLVKGQDRSTPESDREGDRPRPEVLDEADHIQILCTGSLHLVGGCIRVIDPAYCDRAM